jgi:hypothetical protein
MAMLGNASYIERELPNVSLPEPLRARLAELCGALIGTKHDIFTELGELDDMLVESAPDADIAARVERIVRWLSDDLPAMHELVTALQAASDREPSYTAGCLLVTESAANILNAYALVRAAAERA